MEIKSSNKITEIVFSDAAYTVLKSSFLKENDIINFQNNICIDDISNLQSVDAMKIAIPIRIWTSHIDTYEYLNMLYLCANLSNNISVIFVDEYDQNCYSLGCAAVKELESILEVERTLTEQEIEKYKNLWNRLQQENSELRIIEENTIKSVEYDYLTPYILNHIGNNEIKIKKLLGRLLADDMKNNFPIDVWLFLIKRLLKKRIIETTIPNTEFLENSIKMKEK